MSEFKSCNSCESINACKVEGACARAIEIASTAIAAHVSARPDKSLYGTLFGIKNQLRPGDLARIADEAS